MRDIKKEDLDTYQIVMDKLRVFEANTDYNEFKEVFGEEQGAHLWNKFTKLGRKIIFLYGMLDENNKKRLLVYIHYYK